MNLKELRERLAYIQTRMNELDQAARNETRALSTEEREEWTKLSREFLDVRSKIQALESTEDRSQTLNDVNSFASRSDGNGATPPEPGAYGSEYRNLGEFLHDVRFRPQVLEQREQSMGTGSEGGYLVPPQFASQILMVKPEEAIIRPRAFVVPAGDVAPDAEFNITALSQGDNVFGGVSVVWTEEGATMSETDAELENVKIGPQEVTGYITVTNKLLRNAPVTSVLLNQLLRGALLAAEDYAFLRGDGIGKPLGILNCPGKIAVSRATASHVYTNDVIGMLAKMIADGMSDAIFVASQSIFSEIYKLKDENSNNIYIGGDIHKGQPNTLLGQPLFWTGRTPTLGNAGDLMLISPKHYIIKDGSGPFVGVSEHAEFKANKTVIKIVRSVDGQGWVKDPITLEDGSTQVSPFVTLS